MFINIISYTFMINGNLSENIQAERGLREGDPMSPYIFILLMEYLTRCLDTLKEEPDYNYYPSVRS